MRIKTLRFLEVEAAKAAKEKFGALPRHLVKKKPEFQKGVGVMGVMARVIEPPKMKAVKSSLQILRSLHVRLPTLAQVGCSGGCGGPDARS